MSSEMIERVAKAIYASLVFDNDLKQQPVEIQKLYNKIAKAMIDEASRE